jgi:hypothetical protein
VEASTAVLKCPEKLTAVGASEEKEGHQRPRTQGGAQGTSMQEETFVGRERELAELWGYLGDALAWRGKICFVVGQAGSGKTALVRYLLQQALSVDPNLVVATGTSNARAGIGDPYLPFREALASSTALMGSIGSKGLRPGCRSTTHARARPACWRWRPCWRPQAGQATLTV